MVRFAGMAKIRDGWESKKRRLKAGLIGRAQANPLIELQVD